MGSICNAEGVRGKKILRTTSRVIHLLSMPESAALTYVDRILDMIKEEVFILKSDGYCLCQVLC